MKFEIIVPHWNEKWEEVKPLLDSIAIQQGIAFSDIYVTIINDGKGSEPLELATYDAPYPLRQFTVTKRGVSAVRNYGLDKSDADYVMFCDADDMFCHALALYVLFIEMNNGFDVLVSNFVEEHQKDNKSVYITHEKDFTFIHGKVYRRQYLVDNDIRFNNRLTVHEDGYFNVLAGNFTNNIRYMSLPIYLWKWRSNSVVRHEDNFVLKTLDKFIDAGDELIANFETRGRYDLAQQNVCSGVVGFYFMFNSQQWLGDEFKELRPKAGKRLYEYLKKYAKYWRDFDVDTAEILFHMKIYESALTVDNAREQIIKWAEDFIA